MGRNRKDEDDKLVDMPCKLHPTDAKEVENIALAVHRTKGAVSRLLLLRGLEHYKRDGLLHEPEHDLVLLVEQANMHLPDEWRPDEAQWAWQSRLTGGLKTKAERQGEAVARRTRDEARAQIAEMKARHKELVEIEEAFKSGRLKPSPRPNIDPEALKKGLEEAIRYLDATGDAEPIGPPEDENIPAVRPKYAPEIPKKKRK